MTLVKKLVASVARVVPDRPYSIAQFVLHQKRLPRLRAPRTFNEKMLWLKTHHRDPLLHVCADKIAVRDHVRSVIVDDIAVPLLGVYEHPGEISYESLPDRFVLKPTHGSGWVILCRSQRTFDRDEAARKLTAWLQTGFYLMSREWPYKGAPRRIVCEEFLTNDGEKPPLDYKFWCFNGEPACVQVDRERFIDAQHAFYDLDWNKLPVWIKPRFDETIVPKPVTLPRLIEIARRLAAPFPFVRVDLYTVGDRVYFGELTFAPRNMRCWFRPERYDLIFGDKLVLPGQRAASPSDASGTGDGV